MARITGKRSSYGHRISVFMGDCYRLSWSFDVKLQGSRLRWPRTMTRDTDEAGALRFAKKWNLAMPARGGPGRGQGPKNLGGSEVKPNALADRREASASSDGLGGKD